MAAKVLVLVLVQTALWIICLLGLRLANHGSSSSGPTYWIIWLGHLRWWWPREQRWSVGIGLPCTGGYGMTARCTPTLVLA